MFKMEELAGHGRLTITQSSEAVQRLPGGQADSASKQPGLVTRGTFAQYVDYSPRALLAWLSAKPGWRSFSHEYLVSWGVRHLPLVAAGQWWLWATGGEAKILIITHFSCQEASCVCRRAASEGSADAEHAYIWLLASITGQSCRILRSCRCWACKRLCKPPVSLGATIHFDENKLLFRVGCAVRSFTCKCADPCIFSTHVMTRTCVCAQRLCTPTSCTWQET